MAVGVYVHVLCTCRWHPVRPPFHLHPYSLLHTSFPIIFSSATSRFLSLSLSLSLFLFLLSSLLINKLDYWFRKPTGKRIDRDTGRKTEWRQRDRERETPTPLTFSGIASACINPPPNVRLTRRSDCVPTATWKTTSVVWHIIWSTYHLYLHQRDTMNTKGDRRLGIIPPYSGRRFFRVDNPSGITTRHIIFIFIYRIYLFYLGYWDLRIKARRKNYILQQSEKQLLSRIKLMLQWWLYIGYI